MLSENSLRLAVSQRVLPAPPRDRDALEQEWIACLGRWDALPLLLPNALEEVEVLLEGFGARALLLTGGNTPHLSGTGARDQVSLLRDAQERRALAWALGHGLPVLGICRGAQMLDLHFGGRVRRCEDEAHAGTHHRLLSEAAWAPWLDGALVNSHHAWCLPESHLGEGLVVDARAPDGGVEAFHHRELPVLGLMWHPERDGGRPEGLDAALGSFLRGDLPWWEPDAWTPEAL